MINARKYILLSGFWLFTAELMSQDYKVTAMTCLVEIQSELSLLSSSQVKIYF